MADGPVLVDVQALQSPDYRGRGIARYAYELALALERRRPDLVGRFLLNPDLAPPGEIEALLESGKVAYRGTPAADDEGARVLHALSPIELGSPIEAIWPRQAHELGWRFLATVYDLIPLEHPATYLADPRQRRRYLARLEVLRAADGLLAISPATARAVTKSLGIDAGKVATVGTGTSPGFRPPDSLDEALATARGAVEGLEPSFVLYPSGSDGRKNNEALIRAFALLPEALRAAHQLVIAGELPALMANHLRHVAGQLGIGGRLLLTGYLPDEVMVALDQATALLCFPSLIEGFGLPVAEALACGAVAVVADIESLADLVGPAARFDPGDDRAIAAAIERGLTDGALRQRCRAEAEATHTTWDDVADRVAAVYERALAARARGRPVRRGRGGPGRCARWRSSRPSRRSRPAWRPTPPGSWPRWPDSAPSTASRSTASRTGSTASRRDRWRPTGSSSTTCGASTAGRRSRAATTRSSSCSATASTTRARSACSGAGGRRSSPTTSG